MKKKQHELSHVNKSYTESKRPKKLEVMAAAKYLSA